MRVLWSRESDDRMTTGNALFLNRLMILETIHAALFVPRTNNFEVSKADRQNEAFGVGSDLDTD